MTSLDTAHLPRVAVLDDYDGSIEQLTCWAALRPHFQIDFFSRPISADELAQYEVIVTVRERTVMTRERLQQATRLRHLALTGRLSGQADLETLKERGIAVSYTEGSGSAAAELTIALILGVTKGVAERDRVVRAGGWQSGPATMLAGKTLGILGLGRIGTKVAQFGTAMNMRVVSWGPTEDRGRSEQYGVARLSLEQLFQESDIVAICLRLSDKTRGIIDQKVLALLKDGACLVNTARAEIVDKRALYDVLASGRIRGAFDVFYEEPLPVDDPMRTYPTVLLSPHMGYVTNEVYQIFFSQVVQNILAWTRGESFKNALAGD